MPSEVLHAVPPDTGVSGAMRLPTSGQIRQEYRCAISANLPIAGTYREKRLLGLAYSILRQPRQSFIAGLKIGKCTAGEATQVLRELLRKAPCSHECGFFDKGLVKDGGFLQDADGFFANLGLDSDLDLSTVEQRLYDAIVEKRALAAGAITIGKTLRRKWANT